MTVSKRRDPESLLPLTPATLHVLLALADGDKHGYAVIKEVTRRTSGAVTLGAGTLYAMIRRLLADGLILETEEEKAEHARAMERRRLRLERRKTHRT